MMWYNKITNQNFNSIKLTLYFKWPLLNKTNSCLYEGWPLSRQSSPVLSVLSDDVLSWYYLNRIRLLSSSFVPQLLFCMINYPMFLEYNNSLHLDFTAFVMAAIWSKPAPIKRDFSNWVKRCLSPLKAWIIWSPESESVCPNKTRVAVCALCNPSAEKG